jgi:hypothetical protein
VESRTRLTLGGMATVAASVAVVCAVAMTTSAALADSPGTPAGAPVLVPAAAATTSPAVSEGSAPAPAESAAASPVPPAPVDEPQTVPAPEPEDVAASAQAPSAAGQPPATTEQRLVDQAAASGTWDDAYAWAQERGWSEARTEAWIARLDAKLAEQGTRDAGSTRMPKHLDTLTDSAQTVTSSGRDHSGPTSGSKRERSQVPPG